MNSKTTGWFYVGEGLLRYRDERGRSGHYLEAESVRGTDGSPPAPPAFTYESGFDEAAVAASQPSDGGVSLRIRAPRLTRRRHRAP